MMRRKLCRLSWIGELVLGVREGSPESDWRTSEHLKGVFFYSPLVR